MSALLIGLIFLFLTIEVSLEVKIKIYFIGNTCAYLKTQLPVYSRTINLYNKLISTVITFLKKKMHPVCIFCLYLLASTHMALVNPAVYGVFLCPGKRNGFMSISEVLSYHPAQVFEQLTRSSIMMLMKSEGFSYVIGL